MAALVVPGNAAGIAPPPAPALAPTVQDARAAQVYAEKVKKSCESGGIGAALDADVVSSSEYELSLFSQRAGAAAAPPWFAPIQIQLNIIDNRLKIMDNRLKIMENQNCSDGQIMLFHVINFSPNAAQNAGADPTMLGLPHLNNTTTIKNLTNNDVNSYLQGYGIALNPATTYDKQKSMLASHIGCRDWQGLI